MLSISIESIDNLTDKNIFTTNGFKMLFTMLKEQTKTC